MIRLMKQEVEFSKKKLNEIQNELEKANKISTSLNAKHAKVLKLNQDLKIKCESIENEISKSPTKSSQFSYVTTNLHPLISREQIRDYFIRVSGNSVLKIKLIPNGQERWMLPAASAIIVFERKLDTKFLNQCHFMRGKQILIQPIEDEKNELISNYGDNDDDDDDNESIGSESTVTSDKIWNNLNISSSSVLSLASTRSVNSTLSNVSCSTQYVYRTRSIMIAETKLPFLSNEDILNYFSEFGKVIRFCRGKKSKYTVNYRYLFIKFVNYACVEAVMKVNEHKINDKIVQVKLAKDW